MPIQTATVVSTLLGTVRHVTFTSDASPLDYPDPEVSQTLGQVFAARVYAKDLTSLELASSGSIALSPNDTYVLGVSVENDAVLVQATDAAGALDLAGPGTGTRVSLTDAGNIYITASNDIYMKAKSLILDVANMDMAYNFQVNPRGELELQQRTANADGAVVKRTVARFGGHRGL
jgi:hypothetical protein